ncbi:MAG: hypothetical protein AAGA54_32760 [Myxococcota bacterium]
MDYRYGWIVTALAVALGCGEDELDEPVGGDEATAAAESTEAADLECPDTPTAVATVQLEGGGPAFAMMDYTVAGGPRMPAVCQAGRCAVYAGAGESLTFYARFEDCDEVSLQTVGTGCDADTPATVAFSFYEGCDPGGASPDTD